MSEQSKTSRRESGFYRIKWNGRLAIGFLHTPDEPSAWDPEPSEHWSILFPDVHLVSVSASYMTAQNIPDELIGERIECSLSWDSVQT